VFQVLSAQQARTIDFICLNIAPVQLGIRALESLHAYGELQQSRGETQMCSPRGRQCYVTTTYLGRLERVLLWERDVQEEDPTSIRCTCTHIHGNCNKYCQQPKVINYDEFNYHCGYFYYRHHSLGHSAWSVAHVGLAQSSHDSHRILQSQML
jgi:hypothetical protein